MSETAESAIKIAGYYLEWDLIEDEKAALAERSKDLFKAMKDDGFTTKAARITFREKRTELTASPDDVAKAEEAEAINDLYRAALDSGLAARAGRAHAHVENIKDFVRDTLDRYPVIMGALRASEATEINSLSSEPQSSPAKTDKAEASDSSPEASATPFNSEAA